MKALTCPYPTVHPNDPTPLSTPHTKGFYNIMEATSTSTSDPTDP